MGISRHSRKLQRRMKSLDLQLIAITLKDDN